MKTGVAAVAQRQEGRENQSRCYARRGKGSAGMVSKKGQSYMGFGEVSRLIRRSPAPPRGCSSA